jgi:NADP-dependent 3-hydroxy acid dehydrogenase YdfG
MVAGALTEAVLITGCSSGIGRAAAASLQGAGLRVYATARRAETLADLAARGIATLPLDVTDETSMAEAVAAVEADAGAVGTLINNAGYGLYGPVEQVPMAEIRRQFETNFFGLVRLTQLVLPGMRRRHGGRILNVSSMGGRATLPGGAFYHASKYAVEAFSDALRMEVAQFGIEVVLIEPGPVQTPWNDVAAGSLGDGSQRIRRRPLRGLQGRGRCLVHQGLERPPVAARVRCAGHRHGHHPGGHRPAAAHALSDQPGRQECGGDEPAAARTCL